MITRSMVDARGIRELLVQEPRVRQRNHEDLTEVLREYGVLVLTCQQDEDELMDAIKAQPQRIRELWVETIKALKNTGRYVHSAPPLRAATSALFDGAYPREVATSADLVVVGSDVARRVGFEDEGFTASLGGPELVMPDVIRRCMTVRRLIDLSQSGNFPEGTTRDSIWTEVMAPLAAVSEEATILDRYLLSDLSPSRHLGGHVPWLLQRLNRAAPRMRYVRLLAGVPRPWNPRTGNRMPIASDELDGILREAVRRLMIDVTVKVVVAPWGISNEKGPHDRHMRFSCGSAIGVEEGFDRLNGNRVWGLDGLSWKHLVRPEALQGLKKREDYVLGHPDRIELLLP